MERANQLCSLALNLQPAGISGGFPKHGRLMQRKENCRDKRAESGRPAVQPLILPKKSAAQPLDSPGKPAAETGTLKELVAVSSTELLGKMVRKRKQYSRPGLGSALKRRAPTARRAVPPVSSLAPASSGIELIQLCDLIQLANLIPDCEPLLETPKTIVCKARECIITLTAELKRSKALHRAQIELLRHEIAKPNVGLVQQSIPGLVRQRVPGFAQQRASVSTGWIQANLERAKP